ncbi:helix-turn-helix domain-containing protein [Actinokineospora sp. NPDC004072]
MVREPDALTGQRRELGARMATVRRAAGLTQAELAGLVFVDRSTIAHAERGRAPSSPEWWAAIDTAVGAGGALISAFGELRAAIAAHQADAHAGELARARAQADAWRSPTSGGAGGGVPVVGVEHDADLMLAWELARRVAATDVTAAVLDRLESAFDELAMAYPVTPPAELLVRVRQYVGYTMSLMDGRATLGQRRRLITVAGWLSLLAATVHIDLTHPRAAGAHLATAASLAGHVGNREIRAWALETEAWRVLTEGDHPRALELSRAAQYHAPRGSSVAIQATAQQGRAAARLGDRAGAIEAIGRVHKLIAPLTQVDGPEHHYRYDPTKAVAYTATTLAWAGDPAAEDHARDTLARLDPDPDVSRWPRRVASAYLDLALALTASGRLDEACTHATRAIESGRVVPSNHWRAQEVVRAVSGRDVPEAVDLVEAYRELTADTRANPETQ